MSGYRCTQIQARHGHSRSNAAILNPARLVIDALFLPRLQAVVLIVDKLNEIVSNRSNAIDLNIASRLERRANRQVSLFVRFASKRSDLLIMVQFLPLSLSLSRSLSLAQ